MAVLGRHLETAQTLILPPELLHKTINTLYSLGKIIPCVVLLTEQGNKNWMFEN